MALVLINQNDTKEYWQNKLYSEDHKTFLAPDPKPIDLTVVSSLKRLFKKQAMPAFRKASELACVELSTVLYTAWFVLLQRYLNTNEVCYGAFLPGEDKIIAVQMNTALALSLDETVLQTQALIDHERSMSLTIGELREIKEKAGHELPFNTVVGMGGDSGFVKDAPVQGNDLFLRFTITETIEVEAFYRECAFEAATVDRMLGHLENIALAWINQPQAAIESIDYISSEEKEILLQAFNSTQFEFSSDAAIHRLFEAQVERTPDRSAVVCGEETLTYKQLDEQSNRLARILVREGIGTGDIVGIMAGASTQMIVSILGILKAGAAYLPIDPNYPAERVRFMLEDSQTRLMLTTPGIRPEVAFQGEVWSVNDEWLKAEEASANPIEVKPTDLAYIIYTSGSTGTPKGVMIEHRSLVNLAQWHQKYFHVTELDRAAKYAGFGFDASVWEIFPYLISGASLSMVPDEIRLDSEELNAFFHQQGITISFLPTQLCEQFMGLENTSLRVLLTGGDKLKTFRAKSYELFNCYGPTENAVVTTSHKVTQLTDNIPIGKPVYNSQILILDAAGKLQPIGMAGELCVSGAGLARGYLHRPDLTSEKFVSHPYAQGERMYRTGDLARWLPDGTIEFLGRIDHQVKIRGFRIEIGEIEQQLLQHDAVKDCVVMAREDQNGANYLCAYVVVPESCTHRELADFLSIRLPDYMVPARFVTLSSLPVNANGKVDRRALPEPERAVESAVSTPAANETESQLIELWQKILGLANIGADERFFEIGGHSLQAALLRGQIEQRFGVRLPITDLFQYTTVREQALRIAGMSRADAIRPVIEPAPAMEHYPVYPAQRRMYLIEQMEGVGTAYNTPMLLRIEGKLDVGRLEQTIQQLIDRHDMLRTSFQWVGEEILQTIRDYIPFRLQVFTAGATEVADIMREFVQPFDLEEAPLMRTALVSCSDDLHYLLLDFHHIAVDGVSMHLFFEEWSKLYGGEELPALSLQFKDFAVWYGKQENVTARNALQNYWKSALAGEIPILHLPTDMERPLVQSFKGNTVSIQLEAEMTDGLKKLAASSDTTLYMILFAAYNVLLARYSGQEDIVVGAPFACRTENEMQHMIGMFVNTLPLRSYPEKNKSFSVFLQEIRACVLGAIEHQEYELEHLLQDLNIPRVPGRNPLFDTLFVMQNTGRTAPSMEGSEVTVAPYVEPIAKYDLMVDVNESEAAVRIDFQYCTDLFRQDTVERMIRHYIRILQAAVSSSQLQLSEIVLLDETEVHEQVYGLNDTAVPYRKEATIQTLFEEQALQTPDHPALVFGNEKLTYRELNEKANRLAGTLIDKGIQADEVVGLMTDRSLEMIVGLLGILKAGGAYVPIDPEYPQDRVNYMLSSSGARLLLTQTHLAGKTTFEGGELYLNQESVYSEQADNPQNRSKAHNLLYVIYTSGTTGKPKGVMLEHGNMVNLLQYEFTQTNVDYSGKVLQFTTLSFDVCSQEIWSTLLAGGTLYLVTNDTRREVGKLLQVIEDEGINILFMPVSFLKFILNEKEYADRFPTSVRHIITAGEQLIVPEKFREHLRRYQVYLHNHYGPSETHVATTYTIDPNGDIPEIPPIGRPIANTSIYILNDRLQVQPPGVPGELYIAGDCVGRGYYGQDHLTAERYLPDPYAEEGRMYKTGDLARWNEDGTLEFLGRLDHQVKIRGFRIELGEIENTLLNYASVKESIVLAKEDGSGGKYLCAYIAVEEELSVMVLRSHLAESLPDYMIPSYFVQLPALPLTPNGKIDRRALPEPELGQLHSGSDYVAPRTETESRIAEVWQDLLGVARIGIHDNFFELGGHSLKAAVMVARLQQQFEIGINDVFEHQTIAALSAKVKTTNNRLMDKLAQLKNAHNAQSAPSFDDSKEVYRLKNEKYDNLDVTKKVAYSHVLLTGATGYLGIHLLRDMLSTTSWTVHVIVRGDSDEQAAHRMKEKLAFYFGSLVDEAMLRRIKVYRGDLTQERFGLPEETYLELSRTVDGIVHSAATVKHYGTYDYFEQHNIIATDRLLTFAELNQRKDIHHISTLGVASGTIAGESAVYFTEYDLDLGQQYENYYAKTKHEAERRVVLARETGIRSSIYRIGNIVFHSETGKFQENIGENAFYTMIQSFIRLGMVPEMEPDTDFSYVDAVSRAIVLLMQPEALQNEIFHLFNPHRESLHRILADGRLEWDVKPGSFEQFIDYMTAKYEADDCRDEIEKIMLHYGWLEQHHNETVFETSVMKTVAALNLLGFSWKAVEPKQINAMIAYCKEVGFL
ncbi:non-ribosomal peptide synthetase [Paenibacillus planticolens]|uniref:Amino acid adenylation domain-containing protein n=1 Tax=Paenibacillus planticolens TaxID=2654976 RepID=A0ABX1ZNY1_9BACL|nr:non-ribosomal peptide synthetase [Paenibacillus planticolens]NOV00603.1 amino acid adenylation domain-containing protein [Paenibacillus planticolens]